ncbi:hypothetical protein IQ241_23385 [Romeria aff. gracilis LEGE 07310]|uniref:Uncharacterized protein n=1 Tax=Vasconcelosia minhoensis LEGE 07310 TaxID=915328 RepID=A0A8J7DSF7_9CYAN|nr:hypothetical protein [Romeria gracilis]MBE9080194.1 hypothetical protein [Romeria aff. gracilis LEGE 07310]
MRSRLQKRLGYPRNRAAFFGYHYGSALGWPDAEDSAFGDPATMRIKPDSEPVKEFQAASEFSTSRWP